LGVLSRLIANPWIRMGLLIIVLACCGYGLYAEWPKVQDGLQRLHWYSVAASAICAAAGAGCTMLAWRALLDDLGSKLSVRSAIKINFLAQLAKYVPGAVWSFAAQVELGHDQQVPRRRGAASVAIALAVTVGVGLGIAAIAMPLASASTARHFIWVLAVIPVIGLCLWPPVLGWLLDRALKLFRQQPLEQRPTGRGLSLAIAWTTVGWVLLGMQVWCIAADITGRGTHVLLLSIGAYALATSAGLLLIVFPSGIGARELILVAALAPVMPRPTAIVIALMARVVTTVSDLAWGGTALALRRAARRGKHRRTSDGRAAGSIPRQAEMPRQPEPLG
jgi:glycosyltransferase 2 family protein